MSDNGSASSSARFPFAPVSQVCQCLHAWHVPADDRREPISAFHYCSHSREGMHQCVVYDGPGPTARLIGIEYVISEELFKTLPEDEKRYWHSHKAEVESGLLVALGVSGAVGAAAAVASSALPGTVTPHGGQVPEALERGPMRLLHKTYGKAIHTWHPPAGDLPLGPPALMMSVAGGAEEDPRTLDVMRRLAEGRKQQYGVDTDGKRKERELYLDTAYVPAPGADAWLKSGKTPQFSVVEKEVQGFSRK